MLPTIVLVGRPNVGKSTLFNRITRSKSAIVADTPGVTRDRHYGHGRLGERPFLVVDTGGFEPAAADGMVLEMARQTLLAVTEADAVVFLVDAREGLSARDQEVAQRLRSTGQRVWLAVNKAEGLDRAVAGAEFHELGLGQPWPISAAHGDGVGALIEDILAALPIAPVESEQTGERPRIAVVGRPNAGKSTLVNALLGQERLITSSVPGTTRDSITVDFEHRGHSYALIDTAGLRRRARISEAVEKFSVIRALQSIEEANVAILVVDATEGVSDQDGNIAAYVIEAGRAIVVAVNKSDLLSPAERSRLKLDVERRLNFLDFARFHFISAKGGKGLDPLMRSVNEAYRAAFLKMPTPRLTRAVRDAIAAYPPPRKGLSRPKLRYAHQGGSNPPMVVAHGTGVANLPQSYRRYLEGRIRAAFKLHGTPLRIEYRQAENPYVPSTRRSRH
ncbi:MAG: ribosome biogenesis GTPase Der [Betaproteobacteria bacterium]|nr:MAG: ribosome biogenesis GTPase Der [Betaproteobacteria bacterium]